MQMRLYSDHGFTLVAPPSGAHSADQILGDELQAMLVFTHGFQLAQRVLGCSFFSTSSPSVASSKSGQCGGAVRLGPAWPSGS